jgi:hypothetical protein
MGITDSRQGQQFRLCFCFHFVGLPRFAWSLPVRCRALALAWLEFASNLTPLTFSLADVTLRKRPSRWSGYASDGGHSPIVLKKPGSGFHPVSSSMECLIGLSNGAD